MSRLLVGALVLGALVLPACSSDQAPLVIVQPGEFSVEVGRSVEVIQPLRSLPAGDPGMPFIHYFTAKSGESNGTTITAFGVQSEWTSNEDLAEMWLERLDRSEVTSEAPKTTGDITVSRSAGRAVDRASGGDVQIAGLVITANDSHRAWVISCYSTQAGSADDVRQACDRALETFTLMP